MSTISTERTESIDREDEQETPLGADRLTNLNTTLTNNNNNRSHHIITAREHKKLFVFSFLIIF